MQKQSEYVLREKKKKKKHRMTSAPFISPQGKKSNSMITTYILYPVVLNKKRTTQKKKKIFWFFFFRRKFFLLICGFVTLNIQIVKKHTHTTQRREYIIIIKRKLDLSMPQPTLLRERERKKTVGTHIHKMYHCIYAKEAFALFD